MVMRAMFFFCEPFLNPQFSNPLKLVEYVWRGLAVWEQKETYVRDCLKSKTKGACYPATYPNTYPGYLTPTLKNTNRNHNCHYAEGSKKLHCPSYQFVETGRLMAHAATNHVLKKFLLKDQDGLSWDDLGLCRCNNNPLEGQP